LYRIEVSVEIAAPASRVWRALCDPHEVVRWDSGVSAALDAPPDYPRPGQRIHWRYRSRLFPILIDRPQEVVLEQKLRSILRLGPYHIDETYLLTPVAPGCHLAALVGLEVRLPLIGALVERLYAGPAGRRGLQASLAALKSYCETAETDGT
jgi:hypothetical protein